MEHCRLSRAIVECSVFLDAFNWALLLASKFERSNSCKLAINLRIIFVINRAGPTGVVLKQAGHVTFGALANHIWSFAGDSDRADVSATFFQPFFSYTTPTAWSFTLQAESTYDWKSEEWNIPIGMFVSKVAKFGKQPVQFMVGPRYYAEHTENGPRGWGMRAGVVFMFPK